MKALSDREYEVLVNLINGVRLFEWAKLNGLSKITAWNYVMGARKKLQGRTTAHSAVIFALRYNYFLSTQGSSRPKAVLRLRSPTLRQLRSEERLLYQLLAEGLNRDEIVAHVGKSERRISNVLSRSYYKLGARTLIQAVVHFKLYYGMPDAD